MNFNKILSVVIAVVFVASVYGKEEAVKPGKWKEFEIKWGKQEKKELKCCWFQKKSSAGYIGTAGGLIWKTYGGEMWSVKKTAAVGDVLSIGFADNTTGWFSTSEGEIFTTVDGGSEWTLGYKRKEGGSVWKVLPVTSSVAYFACKGGGIVKKYGDKYIELDSGVSEGLFNGFFFNELTGYVIGKAGNLLFTKDGGKTWEAISGLRTRKDYWTSAFCSPNKMILLSDEGLLLKANKDDTGAISEVTKLEKPKEVSLNTVICREFTGELWTCGDSGTVLHSVDGGENWTDETIPDAEGLLDISCSNEGDIWTITDKTVYKRRYVSFYSFASPMVFSQDNKARPAETVIITKADKEIKPVKWSLAVKKAGSTTEVYGISGDGLPPSMIKWTGKDNSGQNCPAGAYDCSVILQTENGDKFISSTLAQIDFPPRKEKALFVNLFSNTYKYGQNVLDRGAIQKLKEAAGMINKYSKAEVQVRGFAVQAKSLSQRQCFELSYDRAMKVAEVLVAAGAPKERLSIIGFGSEPTGPDKPSDELVEVWMVNN